VPTYLVESYLPQAEAAAAVAALVGIGPDARHRWSLVLPEEEMCLHVLDGPSVEVVREATALARLRCQRISRVDLISAEQLELQHRKEGR
jgi:hypothetical protein